MAGSQHSKDTQGCLGFLGRWAEKWITGREARTWVRPRALLRQSRLKNKTRIPRVPDALLSDSSYVSLSESYDESCLGGQKIKDSVFLQETRKPDLRHPALPNGGSPRSGSASHCHQLDQLRFDVAQFEEEFSNPSRLPPLYSLC